MGHILLGDTHEPSLAAQLRLVQECPPGFNSVHDRDGYRNGPISVFVLLQALHFVYLPGLLADTEMMKRLFFPFSEPLGECSKPTVGRFCFGTGKWAGGSERPARAPGVLILGSLQVWSVRPVGQT